MRSREAPSSEGGGDLDDSALWAYDDPQTFYTGERPYAKELVLLLNEFIEEEDKYQDD